MLAVTSMMINMILLMAPYLVFPIVNQNGYQMWLLILLMADISLAIATRLSNKVLILPWLISYMIMIIITCVAAPIIIIIMSGMVVQEARHCNLYPYLLNACAEGRIHHLLVCTTRQSIHRATTYQSTETWSRRLWRPWTGTTRRTWTRRTSSPCLPSLCPSSCPPGTSTPGWPAGACTTPYHCWRCKQAQLLVQGDQTEC